MTKLPTKLPKPRPKEKDLTISQLRGKYKAIISNKLNNMAEKDKVPFLTKELQRLKVFPKIKTGNKNGN
tara:strand:+ start:196 stop:402 length:207 start_codon:yes stop_codon:yes gene_type:complete